MRILLVAPSATRVGCGVGDHTCHLGEELAARGCDVHLAADAPAARRRIFRRGLTLHNPFHKHGLGDMRTVARLARDIKPDLVHIQYQVLTYSGRAAVLTLPLLLGRRVAIAVTMHDFLLPHMGRGAGALRAALLKDFLRRSDLILTASAAHRTRAVQAGAREAAVQTVAMASNIEPCVASSERARSLRERYDIGDRTLLTSLGAIFAGGSVDLLLKAIAKVPAVSRHRIRCLIIGGPPAYSSHPEDVLHAVRDLASTLGAEDCARITGFLESEDVSALLQMSRAAIQPQQNAASPTSTSTAAAIVHRKPLLAVGHRELLDPEMPAGAIYLSSPEPDSLADAIRRLADGETLWAPGGQAELEACAHRFSWQHLADQHLRLYGEVRPATAGPGRALPGRAG